MSAVEHSFQHSSSLRSCRYNHGQLILEVTFHGGGTYQYYNVPPTVFEQLLKARSAGKFFNAYIRGVFEKPTSQTFTGQYAVVSPAPIRPSKDPRPPRGFYLASECRSLDRSMPCFVEYRANLTELIVRKQSMGDINQYLKNDCECSRLRSLARAEMQGIYIHVAVKCNLPKLNVFLPVRKKVATMGLARTVGGVPEEIRIYPLHGPSHKEYAQWHPRELTVDSREDVVETLLHEIAHVFQAQHERVMDHEDSFIRAYFEVEKCFLDIGFEDLLILPKRFSGCPRGSKASLLHGVPRTRQAG